MNAMFSMIVLRMKACPLHSTRKEGVTISLNIPRQDYFLYSNSLLFRSNSQNCLPCGSEFPGNSTYTWRIGNWKTRRYRCPRLMPRETFCFSHHSGGFSLCMVDFYTVTGCFLCLHRFPGTLSLCQAGIYLSRLISRAFFFSPDTFSPAMAQRYTIRPPHSTHSNGSRLRNCFTICA